MFEQLRDRCTSNDNIAVSFSLYPERMVSVQQASLQRQAWLSIQMVIKNKAILTFK
jgi:hypothetical protein